MSLLRSYRQKLDQLDRQIIELLAMRFSVAKKIASHKNSLGSPLTDTKRENKIYQRISDTLDDAAEKEMVCSIYKKVMDCSKQFRFFLQNAHFPFKRVGIIGLGIIGGSIAKVIKYKNPEIIIAALKDPCEDSKTAKDAHVVDEIKSSISSLVKSSDLIIIASPIHTVIPFAKKIAKVRTEKPLFVIDVASVKEEIASCFKELTNKNMTFVTTHPMAGSEKLGFLNSRLDLFCQRPWVIIPSLDKKTDEKALKIIAFFGGCPVKMKAELHDQYAAAISHLPQVLSLALLNFVKNQQPKALKIKGPGFESMTRLAKNNPELRKDIQTYNKKQLKIAYQAFIAYLNR